MERINPLKIMKISLGCVLALFIAQSFSLSYATSIVTITLLSVQNTKKDTLLVAVKRFFSFFLALTISIVLFPVLRFSLLALGLYLLLFTFACQYFQLLDGLSMSTVLMVQLWNSGNITYQACLNQFFIMSIGIIIGILTNLYMPDKKGEMKKHQTAIEESFSHTILLVARRLKRPRLELPLNDSLGYLRLRLSEGKKLAAIIERNHLFHDVSYYNVRIGAYQEQFRSLTHIGEISEKLTDSYPQSEVIATFLYDLSAEFNDCCNGEHLLTRLNNMRGEFKESNLPINRKEFEDRAILAEIVRELITILEIKRDLQNSIHLEN